MICICVYCFLVFSLLFSQVDREEYGALQAAISKHAEASHLINHPGWNLKIVQMFEQWRVRHGLCLVSISLSFVMVASCHVTAVQMGPSGAGKTTLLDVLAKSLSETEVPISVKKMNPKAITATQMFGRLDAATNDWTDGNVDPVQHFFFFYPCILSSGLLYIVVFLHIQASSPLCGEKAAKTRSVTLGSFWMVLSMPCGLKTSIQCLMTPKH